MKISFSPNEIAGTNDALKKEYLNQIKLNDNLYTDPCLSANLTKPFRFFKVKIILLGIASSASIAPPIINTKA